MTFRDASIALVAASMLSGWIFACGSNSRVSSDDQAGRAGEGGSRSESGAAGREDSDGESSRGGSGTIDCQSDGDGKTTLVFVNRCNDTLTYRGNDIPGGVIEPGSHACVDIGSDLEPGVGATTHPRGRIRCVACARWRRVSWQTPRPWTDLPEPRRT
jgi:hypothetical protein